jgi:hypothetical protein
VKKLTAQEALERFGYIVAMSDVPTRLPATMIQKTAGSVIPVGTKIVLIEEVPKHEALAFYRSVGWMTNIAENLPYHYKAVAE